MSKRIEKGTFLHPKEMTPEEKMVPISARLPESVAKTLNALSEKHGHTISRLVAHAVEVYLEQIKEHPERKIR